MNTANRTVLAQVYNGVIPVVKSYSGHSYLSQAVAVLAVSNYSL